MGNAQLAETLSQISETDIRSKQVSFLDGHFSALSIFQQHNFQMYKVADKNEQLFLLRIIHSLNTPEAIKVLQEMQEKRIHIVKPNLINYITMAVLKERPVIEIAIVEEYCERAVTLKLLRDRVVSNPLLVQYVSEI